MNSSRPSDPETGGPPGCDTCGAPIAGASLSGLCPKCLLASALQTNPLPDHGIGQSQCGDYILGRQLGRGGMGVVYEAVQQSLRRTVAIKMILDADTFSPAARQRFRFEAETIARLDHPNIVPVYETGEHLHQPYLVMKLIQGDSLRARLVAGELVMPKPAISSKTAARERASEIARFLSRVAQAVHHAHEHNVLHRDLKPANILVDKKGQPHLTDFGLAKLLEVTDGEGGGHTAEPTRLMGTPAYMSPEQAANRRLTPASDVYSLGAILYEMLTGSVPFKGTSLLETVRLLTDQEPRRPRSINPFVDPDLERVCLKCLEKNPAARYASALALAQDLECWVRKEPVRARAIGPLARGHRWVRRNPVGAGLIASLFACLAMALVLLQDSKRREQEAQDQSDMVMAKLHKQLQELWDDTSRPFVEVPSEQLAALAGKPVHSTRGGALQLDFAVTIREAPLQQADTFAPFLRYLEENLKARLGRTVLINLRLYNMRVWANPAITIGAADIQVMSPMMFVRLHNSGSPLNLLFRAAGQGSGVIFARRDSGISRPQDLVGARMAFAHTNAVLSCFGKWTLSQQGIGATNFARCVNFQRETARFLGYDEDGRLEGDANFAHEPVLQRVLSGEFDAGVASRKAFEQHSNVLTEVCGFASPENWFVASTNLSKPVFDALQDIVLNLSTEKSKKLLRPWHKTFLNGARKISPADLQDVQAALAAQENAFAEAQSYSLKP